MFILILPNAQDPQMFDASLNIKQTNDCSLLLTNYRKAPLAMEKGVLAIRRTFSLVGQHSNYQIFKLSITKSMFYDSK